MCVVFDNESIDRAIRSATPFPASPCDPGADFRTEPRYYVSNPTRPISDENIQALRLVAESRKRDQLRRQEKKERIYAFVGGSLAFLLILSIVLCVIGVMDGWGWLDAALHFVSVLRGRGYR